MWWIPICLLLFLLVAKSTRSKGVKRGRPWARTITIEKNKIQVHRLSPLGLHLYIAPAGAGSKEFIWETRTTPPDAAQSLEEFQKELKEIGITEVENNIHANWTTCFLPGGGIPEDRMNKAAQMLNKIYKQLTSTPSSLPE